MVLRRTKNQSTESGARCTCLQAAEMQLSCMQPHECTWFLVMPVAATVSTLSTL